MPNFPFCCGASSTSEDRKSSTREQRFDGVALASSSGGRANTAQVGQESGTSRDKKPSLSLNFGDSVTDTKGKSQKKSLPKPKWVIGLDFGTTFSGFSYARASDDPELFVFTNWPTKGNETPYCKTLTALYYDLEEEGSPVECTSWGYVARSDYTGSRKHGKESKVAYVTSFKLLLMRGLDDPELAASIPAPLTVMSIITDFLRAIGKTALSVIQSHEGEKNFSQDSVQWCVTVPSIWDENAKQQMKVCMVNAGLVGAGGIDSVIVVLEPEAASFHCHKHLRRDHKDVSLRAHDKILVADVGGGTVDIVVQEIVGAGQDCQVQELTESSGGLCGGQYVNESFLKFASKKIPCLEEFLKEDPNYKTRLLRDWEQIKCAFNPEEDLESYPKDIVLHKNLELKWEAYEKKRGSSWTDRSILGLTLQDMKSIFDRVVDDILLLISAQVEQIPDIEVMFVVGGFAESPYLMQRIRDRFGGKVKHIVQPPGPGSAVMSGAVLLALRPDAIKSRIAKKTYGTSVITPFESGVDPVGLQRVTDGRKYCRNRFDVYVRKGDRVEVDKCVTKSYVPHANGTLIMFDLWSTTDKDPRHINVEGTTKEGEFAVSLPEFSKAGELPEVDLSMFFGRSHIEMRAVGHSQSQGSKARNLVLPVQYYV